MALRAPPITGPRLASVKTSSSSANRPCMFMVTPRKSSFLSNGGSLGSVMNLFARLGRIVKSYTNSILSFFEDPEKILEQAVLDMNDDLAKLHQATAFVLASQKQLEIKYNDVHQASEDWYQKKQLALSKGEEGLARGALQQQKYFVGKKSVLKAQLDHHTGVVDTLVSKTHLLERKIQEANLKKDALQARSTAAKTTIKVQEMIGTMGNSSGLSAFERMEKKVSFMESKAEALYILTTNDIDEKFKMLEDFSVEEKAIYFLQGELPPGRTAAPLNTVFPV